MGFVLNTTVEAWPETSAYLESRLVRYESCAVSITLLRLFSRAAGDLATIMAVLWGSSIGATVLLCMYFTCRPNLDDISACDSEVGSKLEEEEEVMSVAGEESEQLVSMNAIRGGAEARIIVEGEGIRDFHFDGMRAGETALCVMDEVTATVQVEDDEEDGDEETGNGGVRGISSSTAASTESTLRDISSCEMLSYALRSC